MGTLLKRFMEWKAIKAIWRRRRGRRAGRGRWRVRGRAPGRRGLLR